MRWMLARSGWNRRRRRIFRLILAGLLVAAPAVTTITAAAEKDPRPPDQQPARASFPPDPATGDCRDAGGQFCINTPRTGMLKMNKHIFHEGETATVTFTPLPGSVVWDLLANDPNTGGGADHEGGLKCTGKAHPDADVLPGKAGGPTSCSWKVVGSTHWSWTAIAMGITGPCANPKANTEYHLCTGTYASDYYGIIGKDDLAISGSVIDQAGKGIAGVRVEAKGPSFGFGPTIKDGEYAIQLKSKGSYKVSPGVFNSERIYPSSKDDYDPSDRDVTVDGSVSGVDFKANGYTLAGHVKQKDIRLKDGSIRKGKPLAGVNLFALAVGVSRPITTDANGYYEVTLRRGRYEVQPRGSPGGALTGNRKFFGDAYECSRGSGNPPGLCVVDLDQDVKDADLVFDPVLKVKTSFDAPDPNSGRALLHVLVTDAAGGPVGNQRIRLKPHTNVGPRTIVCELKGHRAYPDPTPDPGQANTVFNNFEEVTDASGEVKLWVWPGMQSGEYLLDAVLLRSEKDPEADPLVESWFPSESTTAALQEKVSGSEVPADLGTTLDNALNNTKLNTPFLVTTRGADLVQYLLDILPTYVNLPGVDYAPLVGEKAAGIAFYPKNLSNDQVAWLNDVISGKATGGAPRVAVQVIDLDLVRKAAFDLSNVPVPGKPAADKKVYNRAGVKVPLQGWVVGNAGGSAILGRPGASLDEQRINYFGWIRPSTSGTVDPVMDGCSGRAPNPGSLVETHSPIRLLFTDPAGKQLGFDSKGTVVSTIPGAEVITDAKGENRYLLPDDHWTALVSGTGTGPATIEVLPLSGRNAKAFSFDVKTGQGGQLGYSGGQLPTLSFNGKTLPVTSEGIKMTATGLPARLPAASLQTIRISLKDQFGQPVQRGFVDIDGPDGPLSAVTDAAGVTSIRLHVPDQGQALSVVISAAGMATLKSSITAGPEIVAIDPALAGQLGGLPGIDTRFAGRLLLHNLWVIGALVALGIAYALWRRRGGRPRVPAEPSAQ